MGLAVDAGEGVVFGFEGAAKRLGIGVAVIQRHGTDGIIRGSQVADRMAQTHAVVVVRKGRVQITGEQR